MSSSALVGYSSGDDDENRRQADTNYDDVTMDMSDDEKDDEASASDVFASNKDFEEYKAHFDKKESTSLAKARHEEKGSSNEYGSAVEKAGSRDCTHGRDRRSRHKPKKHRRRSRSRDKRSRSRERRSRSRSRERNRGSKSRERRRSRSRDRRRRSRSRDRRLERPVPLHRSHAERQDTRARKLVALGIVGPQAVNPAPAQPAKADEYQAQVDKIKETTGVEVPKYYNPSAINPARYADQIKKRQMLWGGKKAEPAAVAAEVPKATAPETSSSFNKWESTNFGDNQANEKFRRLMGIKGPAAPAASENAAPTSSVKMFADQEEQYERARAITHTQRGLGLGFSESLANHYPPAGSSADAHHNPK